MCITWEWGGQGKTLRAPGRPEKDQGLCMESIHSQPLSGRPHSASSLYPSEWRNANRKPRSFIP